MNEFKYSSNHSYIGISHRRHGVTVPNVVLNLQASSGVDPGNLILPKLKDDCVMVDEVGCDTRVIPPLIAIGIESVLDAVESSMKDAKIVSILVMIIVFSMVVVESVDAGSGTVKLSPKNLQSDIERLPLFDIARKMI